MDEEDGKNGMGPYLASLDNERRRALDMCRILYGSRGNAANGPQIFSGWEHGRGWNSAVAELSYALETLNLTFLGKYGVKVVAEQVKEKYGTLRFYFRVEIEPPKALTFMSAAAKRAAGRILGGFDFGYRRVVDSPQGAEEYWREIPKEEYDAKRVPGTDNPFGWKFKEEDGKYLRNGCMFIQQKSHLEPTRNRVLHAFAELLRRMSYHLDLSRVWSPSAKAEVVREFVDSTARRLVRDAEEKCYGLCEECGEQIGCGRSRRCCTTGWIRYLCERCAGKCGRSYVIENGGKDA